MSRIRLMQGGGCLEAMNQLIASNIVVDAVITDPPYGITRCSWDSIIPLHEMWVKINKLLKPTGAAIIFGSEPFARYLRMSNLRNFKYDWIWDKVQKSNFLNAKKQPLRKNETISVFYQKQCTYNPQMSSGHQKKETKNIKIKQ